VLKKAAADSLANRAALAHMVAREEETKARATAAHAASSGPRIRWKSSAAAPSAEGLDVGEGGVSRVQLSVIEFVDVPSTLVPDVFRPHSIDCLFLPPAGLAIDRRGHARPRVVHLPREEPGLHTCDSKPPATGFGRDTEWLGDLSMVDWGAQRACSSGGYAPDRYRPAAQSQDARAHQAGELPAHIVQPGRLEHNGWAEAIVHTRDSAGVVAAPLQAAAAADQDAHTGSTLLASHAPYDVGQLPLSNGAATWQGATKRPRNVWTASGDAGDAQPAVQPDVKHMRPGQAAGAAAASPMLASKWTTAHLLGAQGVEHLGRMQNSAGDDALSVGHATNLTPGRSTTASGATHAASLQHGLALRGFPLQNGLNSSGGQSAGAQAVSSSGVPFDAPSVPLQLLGHAAPEAAELCIRQQHQMKLQQVMGRAESAPASAVSHPTMTGQMWGDNAASAPAARGLTPNNQQGPVSHPMFAAAWHPQRAVAAHLQQRGAMPEVPGFVPAWHQERR
jgi:hypothetical protein